MDPVATMLWLAWWGAAVLALAVFAIIRPRRGRLPPRRLGLLDTLAAYRAPLALMTVATAAVIVPFLGGTLAGLGTSLTTHAISSLAAAWLIVTALALGVCYATGDPSRGRARCPRCWYDMSAAAGLLTCPECGKTASSKAGLLRTRRRRGLLVGGVTLGLLAGPIWLAPALRDGTWPQRVPTVALIWYCPYMPETGGALTTELHTRIHYGATGAMPSWERRWLARQSVRALVARSSPNRSITSLYALYHVREEAEHVMPLLAELLLDPSAATPQPWYGSVVFGWHLPAGSLLKELMAALESDDDARRLRALDIIAALGNAPHGEVAAPATLLDYARQESDLTLKTAAIECLMAFREHTAAREILTGAARSDDHRLRLWAVLMLSERDPYGGSAILTRVHATDDPVPQVRGAAARLVAMYGPYSEDMQAAILRIAAEPEGGAVLAELVRSEAGLEYRRDTLLAALHYPGSIRPALFAVSVWPGDRAPFLPLMRTLYHAALGRGDADEASYIESLMSDAAAAPRDQENRGAP